MKWEELVDPFTGKKMRRFDWIDDQGHKRGHVVTQDEALYDLEPEQVAERLRGWHSLF
jgi:hypothetical protein